MPKTFMKVTHLMKYIFETKHYFYSNQLTMFYAQKLTEMITKSKFSRVFHPSLAKQEHLYYTVTQQTLCKCSNTSQEKWYFTPLS